MAAPSLATFRTLYPEFTPAPDALVNAKLAAAAAQLDETVWATQHEAGVGALAADMLGRTPEGRPMRLMADKYTTVYTQDYRRLRRAVQCGAYRG